MAGDEVKVNTTDLAAKAIQIRELHLVKSMLGGTKPVPPDALNLSKTAVDNLAANTLFLVQNQLAGSQEGDRLAESLDSVAAAYDAVDAAAQASLDGTGPAPTPVMPAGNEIAAPTPPAPMGAPSAVSPDEIGDVEKTQTMLSPGDHGASLNDAAREWAANATMLHTAAEKFHVRIENWEGEAADQAYAKFVEFGEWLSDLGDAWQRLSTEAVRIADAHVKALLDHTPVYQRYEQLKAQWMAAAAKGGGAAHNIAQQMEPLQRESEAIIEGYASQAAPHAVTPAGPPPSSGVPTVPVTSGGGQGAQTGSPAGTPSGGGAGGQSNPGGSPTSSAASPLANPTKGNPAAGGSPSEGGSPPGSSSPTGGSPSGSGSPSGAGVPNLPGGESSTDLPTLPDDPGLHPAAADAGGGAGGGSGRGAGGGAGGGISPIPLQPSVGGVAVGPAPAGGAGPGVSAPSAGGPGGAAGGGMGGMPMGGHGQGQGGGKERRRTPGLTPDEDVYTEERPWTEAIVGNRRRRDVPDAKDSP